MSTAPQPLAVYIPVAEAVIMASYEGEGFAGDYDIPIPSPVHWRQVVQFVAEGDEIVLRAEADGQVVVEIPAVVIALNAVRHSLEVIA